MNFEKDGETCNSPLYVLKNKSAHCFEGALVAAATLWYHGRPPLLLDLETGLNDESHVIAPFKENGLWGAISTTNHAVLRYREPIHKTIRELVLSYFHEYFLDTGIKTLKSFSTKPLDLTLFDDEWPIAEYPVWGIHDTLVDAPHSPIAPEKALKNLRRADLIEIQAGKLTVEKK